jgi:hypothetical protein
MKRIERLSNNLLWLSIYFGVICLSSILFSGLLDPLTVILFCLSCSALVFSIGIRIYRGQKWYSLSKPEASLAVKVMGVFSGIGFLFLSYIHYSATKDGHNLTLAVLALFFIFVPLIFKTKK